ncbi:MAG: hypothetical protein QOF21_1460 [Actinomycetota bacterium]
MFSDIEGSTRLFHDLGDQYPIALARHQAIVRGAIAGFRGHEVKTEGDSFFVAFHDAPSAVAACVRAQRELAVEPWADDGAIRVRIGLHTGIAEPVDDDYVALDVHRAARVAAVGHGGQILLTAAAVDALGDELPADCSVRMLGRFRLKDFDDPERLSQLEGPGLDHAHPPLRALPAVRHNIRLAPTRFIGRSRERLKLAKLLSDNSIVTVVGQGGIGKSRLAGEVAIDMADDFADGAILVEVGALADDGLVTGRIAEALGGRAEGGLFGLADIVTGRNGLIVLDEAERVLRGVSDAIAAVRQAAPETRILTTSRAPLGIAGEVVFELEPLDTPDADDDPLASATTAVALLFDRLGEADDTDDDPSAVDLTLAATLCRRLDGLPLAIELAAARVPELGLAAVVAGIGTTTESPMSDAVRWSVDLLGPASRRLFRRLGWLASPTDLDTIATIVADSTLDAADVPDLLAILSDRGLVRVRRGGTGPVHYRVLDTVREVAREELAAAGETTSVDESLLRWGFQQAVDSGDTRTVTGAAATDYTDELPLFVSAIDAGIRLRDPKAALVLLEAAATLTSHGAWDVLGARTEALLAIPEIDATPRSSLLVNLVRSDFIRGDVQRGMEDLATLESLFDEVNEHQRAVLEAEIGQDLLRIDPFRASRYAEHALPVLEQHSSPVRLAALHTAGATRAMFGNLDGAREALERCLEFATAANDSHSIANALAALGNVAFSIADFSEAARLLDDAVHRLRKLHAPTQMGPALAMAGHAHALLGDFDTGITMLVESLALRERYGDVVGSLYCKLNLADVYDRAGRRDDAFAGFNDAFSSSAALGIVPLQNAAAHGVAITAPSERARDALVVLAAAVARSIGTTGIDEPVTQSALARLRTDVGANAAEAEAEGSALSDEEFLERAAALTK